MKISPYFHIITSLLENFAVHDMKITIATTAAKLYMELTLTCSLILARASRQFADSCTVAGRRSGKVYLRNRRSLLVKQSRRTASSGE